MTRQQAAWPRTLGWALLFLLAVRLVAMAIYPLADSTEARYAEIARVMLVSGDWITPQLAPGVPFWGKPPLYAWATAGSFRLFAVNEFAARLPHFVAGLGILFLLGRMVRLQTQSSDQPNGAMTAVFVLASMPIFFGSIGAVMTDTMLTLGTTMAMAGFWLGAVRQRRGWGLLLFAGLAIGFLAKGPLTVVLVALPLAGWLTLTRRWHTLRGLPWRAGTALTLAATVPWYLLAEYSTPGFLEYFLVGEHFLRYLQPGWAGDLYGVAHSEAPGTIWWFWVLATLPWCIALTYFSLTLWRRGNATSFWREEQAGSWRLYLLCWSISPLLFFTFSGNILWTYVLPGIPALAALVPECLAALERRPQQHGATASTGREWRPALLIAGSLAPLLTVIGIVAISTDSITAKTEKYLLQAYESAEPAREEPLLYLNKRPHSADFYSAGYAQDYPAQDGRPGGSFWLASREQLPEPLLPACEHMTLEPQSRYRLYHCNGRLAAATKQTEPHQASKTPVVTRSSGK